MSTTITTSGAIVYRTKLMTSAAAERFCRCLTGNRRFCDVTTVQSATARTPKFFVTFRPTSEDRRAEMFAAQWNQRAERAQEEGFDYLFWQDDSRRFWHCLSVSGETYEVHPFGCSCPDYEFRCRKAGLHCKHIQALELQGDAGLLNRPARIAA